jgi:hypothetical protein
MYINYMSDTTTTTKGNIMNSLPATFPRRVITGALRAVPAGRRSLRGSGYNHWQASGQTLYAMYYAYEKLTNTRAS